MRDVLLNAPVLVRLDALEGGRFQAAIQARLMLAAGEIAMTKRSLDVVATALLKRGFQRVERPLLSPDVRPSNHGAVVWLDSQGHHQGRWSLGVARLGQVELLLALGDAPSLRSNPLKRMGQQLLRLRARPDQLARVGLAAGAWQGTSTGA